MMQPIPPFLERYRCNCGSTFPSLTGWHLHQAAEDMTGDPNHRIAGRPSWAPPLQGGTRPMTKDTTELLRVALELDQISTDYRVCLNPADALTFAALQPDPYSLENIQFVTLLHRINDHIPPMAFPDVFPGHSNPNNGTPHHEFYVGKDGNRVLLLDIAKGYLPDDYDYDKLILQLRVWGCDARAVECHPTINDESTLQFRFWWD